MLPELGAFALILALLLSALQAFFGIAGPAFGRERWQDAVVPAVAGQFVMVVTAVGCLVASFVNNDFSVQYVAENSNSALPLFYRVAALWGAHEGSLLLWIFLLACWTLAVTIGVARLRQEFAVRVLGVLGVVSFGFLLFTLATSNPFLRLDPAAPDGRDLNPLLQDPALAAHPPILYTGYVGFAVAFAFACAAMLEGRLDETWARLTRPWASAAWAFLTCGIALGSWWAYYDLGWGGWWFWDRHREARPLQELDPAARHSRLQPEPARHLPGALRGAGLGAFFCRRSDTGHLHSDLPHRHDRRRLQPVCVARPVVAIPRRV
jgi:cytochrome c-type biogenesis protein CcmF